MQVSCCRWQSVKALHNRLQAASTENNYSFFVNSICSTKPAMASAAALQHSKWQSCIYACMRCAEACEFCATSDLKEQDVKMMATCAQINRECASVCWASASLMSIDSRFAKQFCNLCVDICEACARECERHRVDHCQKSAQTCRACTDECRRIGRQKKTHFVYV